MPLENEHFDDPSLKAALRRGCADETAPSELRDRVGQLLAASRTASPARSWRDGPLVGGVAAVVILLSMGWIAYNLLPRQPRFTPTAYTLALPSTLQARLIARHDSCAAQANHHRLTDVPRDNLVLTSQSLEERTGQLIPLPTLDAAWRFTGGALCSVGDAKAAHLVFRRGDQHLSYIILPADACGGMPNGATCESVDHGHAIAGYVVDGALRCLIGSNTATESFPLENVIAIRNSLQAAQTGHCAPPGIIVSR